MKETLIIDNAKCNANCAWCEAPFTKSSRGGSNKLYCSPDCAREVHDSRNQYIPSPTEVKVAPDYADYEDRTGELLDKYGVRVPETTREDRQGGERIAVPEINFKRFKETKSVIVFTSRQEFKRNGWV